MRKKPKAAKSANKRVFVIYGRNVKAYQEVSRYLAAIGVSEITFNEVANLQASPYVTEIVIEGIWRADAVIVLFTPDELAILYQSTKITGGQGHVPTETRWQPRPNVVFEAGIAFALKKDRTILVALGDTVTGFSDIGGIHLVHLDAAAGKDSLRQRLQVVLKTLPAKLPPNWRDASISGNFRRCVPKRWHFYDELAELEAYLRAKPVIQPKITKKSGVRDDQHGAHSLFDIVQLAVRSRGQAWRRSKPREFMEIVRKHFDNSVTNVAYWWLVVAGFFQFEDIDYWFDSDGSWKDSVDYVTISARGLALIDKLST
ncbi:MAG: nucleotide-binding protein [Planctomycetes bacterium]|nr:nucleotide-binding protein [Planctomycetota bacterium]